MSLETLKILATSCAEMVLITIIPYYAVKLNRNLKFLLFLVTLRSDPSSIDEFPDSINETDLLFPIVDTAEFCTSNCDSRQQQHCAEIVQRYQAEPEEAVGLPTDTKEDEYQIHRHVVLLLVLSFSMFVVSWFTFLVYL